MENPERILVCDANVLIDYCEVDRGILTLAAEKLCPVVVLTTTLEKVKPLSAKGCRDLKLAVLEPTTEELLEVAANPIPGLAFDDRVLAYVTMEHKYTCVTNDLKARKYLEGQGSSPLWGLDLLLELIEQSALTATRARSVVKALVKVSPKHYAPTVTQLFEDRLNDILGKD